MKRTRLIKVAILLLILASILRVAPDSISSVRAQPDLLGWSQERDLNVQVTLSSVFMVDQNTAWIAGGDDDAYAAKIGWDGTSWKVLKVAIPPAAPDKLSVISDDNIWATGGPTGIMHYDGSIWSTVPTPPLNAAYGPIQMLGNGEEGWAGGGIWPGQVTPSPPWKPVMLHYIHGHWEQDTTLNGETPVRSLHLTADGGWAVSDKEIWHYQNGAWSQEAAPPFCPDTTCIGGYMGVRALSADEAWAVGWRSACNSCPSEAFAAHRQNGTWTAVLPAQSIVGAPAYPIAPVLLNDVTFTDPNNGWAVGIYASRTDSCFERALVIRYKDGAWHDEPLPEISSVEGCGSALLSVSAIDPTHALATGYAGVALSYGYETPQAPAPFPTTAPTIAPNPTPSPTSSTRPPVDRVPDPQRTDILYFPQVGHTLFGGFLDYWQKNGGLEQFGYPLTEEYTENSPTDGKPYITQWFERARMEWHPENPPPNDILLGLLGRELTKDRENEPAFKPVPPGSGKAGSLYFSETGHTLAPEFTQYWQTHGGLPVYGYPISEPFVETSKTDGKPYLVQYFERNRFEFHPENDPQHQVLLGLLGVDILRARGLIP